MMNLKSTKRNEVLSEIGRLLDDYMNNLDPTVTPDESINHPTALERREMYKVQKKEKPEHKLADYTLATREHIAQMTGDQLAEFGHDPFSGPEQMTAALDTIDALAVYNEPAAWSAYSAFMDSNLSGVWFEFHDETQQ